MPYTHIWWIRRDIRLQDNEALLSAIQSADQLVPLFILEPVLINGAAPKRLNFLFQALQGLDRQLQELGSHLIVRQGPASKALTELAKSFDNLTIFAHEDFSPFAKERDQSLHSHLDLQLNPGVVLRHPNAVRKADGDPYIVYTPYKNKWYEKPLPMPADCIPAPKSLPPLPDGLESQPLPAYQASDHFPGTAEEANRRLSQFIQKGIQHYQSRRNHLAQEGTSRLSPYLRFGLLSVREAFAQAQLALIKARETAQRKEIRTWMDELVWREFYTAILYHHPKVMKGPFREAYAAINWREAPEDLEAWQHGLTGYPIVDACMRQLLATGWMHNRGRMIVASFLTKDLLINWQEGESWFMSQLIDGDPAANNGGWQWSAGTGTDAAPYFRIFNPILQGQKFDTEGKFIARWVPELAALPIKWRHEPWKMKAADAQKYGFRPGKDYPHPIVDHKLARQRTLAAYQVARETQKEGKSA
jgi:deoxyribodipyrimidine photo-lyase